jgi:hypothetical protein
MPSRATSRRAITSHIRNAEKPTGSSAMGTRLHKEPPFDPIPDGENPVQIIAERPAGSSAGGARADEGHPSGSTPGDEDLDETIADHYVPWVMRTDYAVVLSLSQVSNVSCPLLRLRCCRIDYVCNFQRP